MSDMKSNQREENYQQYLCLLKDANYGDVTFDELSGGVSAIHINHRYDKQLGLGGIKRGNYEIRVVDIFRCMGHSIILIDESSDVGVKQYDGLLDGIPCEIKTVEQMGRWTIRTKIGIAIKQGAIIVVLYFPDPAQFSESMIQLGWKEYLDYAKPTDFIPEITLLCVVNGYIRAIEKPSW